MLLPKQRYRLFFASLLISAAFATACAKAPQTGLENLGDSSEPSVTVATENRITIVDASGSPVPGARLMIGTRENLPFPGNVLLADGSGTVALPPEWTDAQPLTVDAPGFIRATYFNRRPGSLEIKLRPMPSTARHELKGETKGYKDLGKDGVVDVGVIFPAITRSQLVLLQATSVISPETDKLSVPGQDADIPSNVAVPTQRESYIIPITLSKSKFRVYLNEARTWKIVAAHARFPLKSVVDDLENGKTFIEIVNKFTFTGASIKDVSMKVGTNTMDLPVNELAFKPAIPVTAPSFDPAYSMLGLSLIEDNGVYFPSDVKRFAPKEKRTLAAPNTPYNGNLVSLLRRSDAPDVGAKASEFSTIVSPLNQSQALEFLPIVKAPELRSGTLVLHPPATSPQAFRPTLTYAVLSKIETVQSGSMKLENKIAQWELYAEEWAKDLTLPQLPSSFDDAALAPEKFRWEVLFGGQPQGAEAIELGPAALEKVSHVTRSAVDL